MVEKVEKKNDIKTYDVIIIGAGPAGYTAAIYTARANLQTIMLAGDSPGGQLLLTSEVENYPGFKDGIMGPELMDEMKAQALRFGTEFRSDFVTKVELDGDIKKVWVGEEEYQAKTIIISTGASANWLNLKNEQRLMGKGISACATCDGFFFTGKHVVVAGGGDSAMEEALTLAKFASKVTIVHRRDEFRASKIMQKRVKDHEKIEIIWNSTIVDVIGENFVAGVRLKDTVSSEEKNFACEGLFVAIGHTPATKLFTDILDMTEKGYIVTEPSTATKIPGVFAAGDVADARYRQAITAAGEGCKAALEAEHFLQNI
ncbi:thioredoxin-disulfide reductase [Candidatus Saccharibacteria bacterium]|nr:thioredoxin-disulfide reductase [Candidatus Saccharibacteria bacterium]